MTGVQTCALPIYDETYIVRITADVNHTIKNCKCAVYGHQLANNFVGGSDLFYGNTSTKLISVNENLFSKCASNITSLNRAFYSAYNLRNIPEKLFDNVTNVTTINSIFSSCIKLTSISENVFANFTKLKTAVSAFYNCKFTTIPENLFKYNTEVTSFSSVFYSCLHLTEIPENIFKHNTKVTNFDGAFRNCKTLTTIPENLFMHNTEVTSFDETFYSMTGLTEIPENLFKYNTKVISFNSTFRDLPNISVPENLFKYNTEVTSFNSTFFYASFRTIPENIFKYNTKVNSFRNVLFTTRLTEIPQNIFKYNTEVTDFYECICGNGAVKSLPEGLFEYNLKVTNFSRACAEMAINHPYNCTLEGSPKLWERTGTNGAKVTNFSTFCGSSASSAFKSTIPTTWGGTMTTCEKPFVLTIIRDANWLMSDSVYMGTDKLEQFYDGTYRGVVTSSNNTNLIIDGLVAKTFDLGNEFFNNEVVTETLLLGDNSSLLEGRKFEFMNGVIPDGWLAVIDNTVSNYPWEFSETYGWIPGNYNIHSTNSDFKYIGEYIECVMKYAQSSEINYDYLQILRNGVEVYNTKEKGSSSSNTTTLEMEITIQSGDIFRSKKDSSWNSGLDKCMIQELSYVEYVIPPFQNPYIAKSMSLIEYDNLINRIEALEDKDITQ